MPLDRKIAFIDLTAGKIKVKPIPVALRRKFLGGRGINMHLLSRHYTPSLNPFSPDNPLIFGAGFLTGCLSFGSRLSITSKSPESGHLGDSNMGGDFGAELVKAGFSHVVISGKSPNPVYIVIQDNQIEIRDAKKLTGLDTIETQKRLRSALKDDKVQIACIGPAGENLVRFAAIRSGMKSSAGRTGMGAVMGSKNVKALAVRGTRDIKLSAPKKYLSYYLATMKSLAGTKWAQALGKYGTPLLFSRANALGILSIRNNQSTSVGDQGYRLAAEALEPYSTGMLACFSCPVHCRHRFVIEKGKYQGTRGEGPEYGSIGSLGSKLGNLDLENSMYAIELCNRYGLDTISTGSYIAWAMELYQRGIIDQKATKRPLVCSLFHVGSVNPKKSAIRIKKDDLTTSMNMPILCRQCKEMKCLPGEKAEGEGEKKKFIWDTSSAGRCPFGALPVFDNKAFHCDLCQGKPQCVKVCTTQAISVR